LCNAPGAVVLDRQRTGNCSMVTGVSISLSNPAATAGSVLGGPESGSFNGRGALGMTTEEQLRAALSSHTSGEALGGGEAGPRSAFAANLPMPSRVIYWASSRINPAITRRRVS